MNTRRYSISAFAGAMLLALLGSAIVPSTSAQLQSAPKVVNLNSLVPKAVASKVSVGGLHTCGLTSSGGVKCWGNNGNGQLGDGTTINRTTPVDVIGLTGGVIAIAAGDNHTCALTSSGGVKCWGWNIFGQLGDGTTMSRTTPVDVSGLTSGVTAIAASNPTCALTSTGGVKCWGYNADGELGDGTRTDRSTPVDVIGLTSGVTAIAVGEYLTCALTSSGGVKCWGSGVYGGLGDGSLFTISTIPVDVSGLSSGASAVVAGAFHACALTTGGNMKCWGANLQGQLGNPAYVSWSTLPVDVFGLTSGVSAIAGGNSFNCALLSTGGVKCWGWNSDGQVGNGTTSDSYTPVDVSGLTSGVSVIATGTWHTCAITTGGSAKCWGDNNYGQLGDGSTTDRHTPVDVIGFEGASTVLPVFPLNPFHQSCFTVKPA